jgi:hypothetical protein
VLSLLLITLTAAFVATPALAVSGGDRNPGTRNTGASVPQVAESAERSALQSLIVRKPDGRIRLSATGYPGKIKPQSGPFVGNNVYNTTGVRQTATEAWYGTSFPGSYYIFDISIQNDGTRADRFRVKATGAATTGWAIKYFRGTTNITLAVKAGTYQTGSLAPGATYLITAKLTFPGGDISRLVTITSTADATRKDAVKFALKYAACGC